MRDVLSTATAALGIASSSRSSRTLHLYCCLRKVSLDVKDA